MAAGAESAKFPAPMSLRIASAMIERAELPVQRKSTLRRRCSRFAPVSQQASALAVPLVRSRISRARARDAFARAVAIIRVFASRKKSFPRDSGWDLRSRIFRIWRSSRPSPLFDDIAAGRDAAVHRYRRNRLCSRPESQDDQARLSAARRNRKIHARIVKHPFGIIRLDDGRLGIKKRGIKADRLFQISAAT